MPFEKIVQVIDKPESGVPDPSHMWCFDGAWHTTARTKTA